MEKIKVVIVDDMIDILNYFSVVLGRESDIEIVGTAQSAAEGIKLVLETRPDVVLMDIQMEHKTAGISAIEKIKEKWDEAKIIVLTIHDDDEQLYRAFAAGAMEYMLKTSSIAQILSSIRAVHTNTLSLRPEISQKILKEFSKMKSYQSSMLYAINLISQLSNSELEVLCAVHSGQSYRKIASDRYVEEVTIRTQVSRILKKTGFGNMKAAIKYFEELNLFDIVDQNK